MKSFKLLSLALRLVLPFFLATVISACGGGGGSDSGNTAPTADAGSNQTVNGQEEVTLTGSGTDSNGTISSYNWSQTGGTEVTLTDSASAVASFTAPILTQSENLTFSLTVTDDDGASDSDEVVITISRPPSVSGGTLSSPVELSLIADNQISSNAFNNYFKFTAQQGDEIIIHVALDNKLDKNESNYCFNNPLLGYDGITIKDVTKTCAERLAYTFLNDGTYTIYFGYESSNSGYFNVAVLPGIDSTTEVPSPESIPLGRPDSPIEINTGANNTISNKTFYNYYKYSAKTGDEIYLQVELDSPLDQSEKNFCLNNPSLGYIGITIKDVTKSCLESFTYKFLTDGANIIHFGYEYGNSGYFNASVALANFKVVRDVERAELNAYYTSSDVVISSNYTTVSIDSGILIKNGFELQNLIAETSAGDIINIKQLSGSYFDEPVVTQIFIGDYLGEFLITTKPE